MATQVSCVIFKVFGGDGGASDMSRKMDIQLHPLKSAAMNKSN